MEPSKTPGVHLSLSLTMAYADPLAHVRQVLKHDGRAGGNMLDKAFGKDVIVVSSLPKQLARKVFQVPFGRLGAFFLKRATQAEDTAFLLFPAALTQECALAGHRRVSESQVNPNHLVGGFNHRSRDGDDHVEEGAPLPETQVSGADLAADVGACMLGDAESDLLTPNHGGNTGRQAFPLDSVRTLVVADRSTFRLGSLDGFKDRRLFPTLDGFGDHLGIACCVFLLPGERTLDGLGGLHSSGTHQLGWQIRILCTQGIVSVFVQLHAVAACGLKSSTRNCIKARCMLLQRTLQHLCLFWCGFQV